MDSGPTLLKEETNKTTEAERDLANCDEATLAPVRQPHFGDDFNKCASNVTTAPKNSGTVPARAPAAAMPVVRGGLNPM